MGAGSAKKKLAMVARPIAPTHERVELVAAGNGAFPSPPARYRTTKS